MAAHYQTGAKKLNYEGKLLVAHPDLNEGIFSRSVIFVYQDDGNGTIGIVLNKPTRFTVAGLLAERGLEYLSNEHIYKGGPSNERAIVMLHEDQWYSSNTIQCGLGLALTSDTMMMEKMAVGNAPLEWRMFAGVSTWGSGQLVSEIKRRNGWLVCDADSSIVFDKDGERQWNSAVKLCGAQMIDFYI